MPDVTSLIDLHDSEILRLEEVLRHLNTRQGKAVPLEAFRKEALERFGLAGFKVDIKVYDTNVTGVWAFDIEILDRLDGEFDPNQQVHEATSDILDLGTKGFIKPGGGLWTPPNL